MKIIFKVSYTRKPMVIYNQANFILYSGIYKEPFRISRMYKYEN